MCFNCKHQASVYIFLCLLKSCILTVGIFLVINCGFISADVAQQFQYAVRVIGSNFAPTVERDEFLVAEKIKKECKFLLQYLDTCFIMFVMPFDFYL